MSTVELKASLYRLIEAEEDELILGTVQQLLKQGRHLPIDELGGQTIEEFNLEMTAAEREIDSGEYCTHEEVVAKFEQLFAK